MSSRASDRNEATNLAAEAFSILVVEDEVTNMLLLRAMLEAEGFVVRSAFSGGDGLEIARVTPPDIVLLDIVLPDMDGFQVCAQLKDDPRTRDVPVIFVTSLGDSTNKLRGLSSGGVDYVTKPYDMAEIAARVRIHLKLRNATKTAIESQKRRLEALKDANQLFLTDLSALPDARCAVDFEPAEEAGGDQYDAVQLAQSVYGYFIADISGHGIASGFHASVLKALFRENASILDSPDETLARINAVMKEYMGEGQHITASYLTINRVAGQAILASAGHLPILVSPASGPVGLVAAEGDILGVFDSPAFTLRHIPAPKGTRFWMVSDGVVEDFDLRIGWKAGLSRLASIASDVAGLPLEEALAAVRQKLYITHPGKDDRLILVCEA